jgi:hypothetical protein
MGEEYFEYVHQYGKHLNSPKERKNSMKKVWMFSPQAGGRKMTPAAQEAVRKRILAYAEKTIREDTAESRSNSRVPSVTWTPFRSRRQGKNIPRRRGETREEFINRLRNTPTHFCRLRHFDIDRWSVVFYTYSHERYEPCLFPYGQWFGTPEQAFDIGAVYLQ